MPAIEQEPAADQEHEKDSVCYFLVCFSNADFVAFLLASLYREEDYFIIHCDIKGPQSIKDYLVALSRRYNNIHILPSRSYSWAGFSHVQITLEAMSEALCRQQSWSHFCALSEQHLPLKSPTEIASFLRNRRTMLAMRSVQQMGGAEYEDIANRFGAIYRELPGVGCFAVDVADRRELLEKVHHGTNWFAIHRSHCQHLVASLASGEFHQFESIVHAEETAIQTLLAPLASDIELRDVTLVAFPHLTDNHSLVMSDELFEQSIDADYLFIRKRTNQLSSFAHDFVTRNHFEPSVYKLLSGINTDQKAEKRSLAAVDAVAEDIQQRLTRSDPSIHVARVDAREFGSTPKIHLIIKHPGLPNKVNVRLLSENLVDFKVLIDKEQVLPDAFEAPRIRNGFLHSTIRSRIYGLFGYEELLPMSERNRGFLTLGSGQTMAEVVDTAKRFLRAAFNLGGEQAQNGSQTPTVETEPAHHEELGASAPRPQRLNALAKLTGASRYLEIGVSRGETFFEVKVPYKVAVDPNFRFDVQARADAQTIFHQISSDEYFGQIATGEPFDLIYLDGLHTFEQTLRDLLSSMRFAHEQTIWVLDDTIPTNAFASLPSEHECWELKKKAGIDDWSWMGDVYKVVFFVARMMPSLQFRTYTGHGQTVIWKGKSTRTIASSPSLPAAEIGMMTYNVMLRHLDEMLMTEEDEILQAIHADLIR